MLITVLGTLYCKNKRRKKAKKFSSSLKILTVNCERTSYSTFPISDIYCTVFLHVIPTV